MRGVPTTMRTLGLVVCLQPLAPYDADRLRDAAEGIRLLYDFAVLELAPRPLPQEAWYPPRSRYRADAILDWLDRVVMPDAGCGMVVGFTSADVSTSKPPHADWGVFGLGELGGQSAVVSTYRLRGWPERTAGPWLEGQRTIKVTNHEVGHVLGVPHVTGEGCLMEDAHGAIATVDGETGLLCDDTRAWITATYGWSLPDPAAFDWQAALGPAP